MSNICHPQAGLLSLHDPVIFESLLKSVTCVQPNVYNLFLWPVTLRARYTRDFVVHSPILS